MITRQIVLPVVYGFACLRHPEVDSHLVILADAHHESLPDSMAAVKEELLHRGYTVKERFCDFQKSSPYAATREMIQFMDDYSQAGCVLLCDYYLPVTACRKRKETKVIQLWHACGAYKKFGYDAKDDIPGCFSSHMFGNLDLVTVSGKVCIPHYASAFHIPEEMVAALGVSRTDKYFSESYRESCRQKFREIYPESKGKRVVVWAPTFRGNAADADLVGLEEILKLKEQRKDKDFFLIKLHPHMKGTASVPACILSTEELLPAADVLISDFSSIIFEFSLFQKPILLFAPDADSYMDRRGTYEIGKLPGPMAASAEELASLFQAIDDGAEDPQHVFPYCRIQMEACDGHATERIARYLEMSR
ncbi:MAG: CDP-glycerol glycerophosphotransferase family protein [Clostridiales bacterium]|nr:CDP-glycerol glycerophosphotransferase family protein [Clostridiales bacterium]